jgi:hypothetical protein
VTLEIAGLAVANAAYLVVGAAAFVALRWVTRDPATWFRLAAAYPFGIVVVVVPASYLALLRVPVAWGATAAGLAAVAAGAVRVYRDPGTGQRVGGPRRWRPRLSGGGLLAFAVAAVTAALVAHASRTFAIRPLVEWDGWGVWTAKARLLYADPSQAPAALRSGNYGQTPYPIALPTLEALGFGAMGKYDGSVIGLQSLALAAAFPCGLWALLRRVAPAWATLLVALAVVGAPQILYQLVTHYADVPLALWVGLGLAAGAAWAASPAGDGWLLGAFAAFLGMAGLTKSEGFLFAAAGAAALAVAVLVHPRRAALKRDAGMAIAALGAIVLPWQLYTAAYGLTTPDYDLAHAVAPGYLNAHAGRVGPVVRELWHQLVQTNHWGLLVWVIPVAVACGFLARRLQVSAFAATWLVLGAGGLVLTYWISTLPLESHLTNTSYRTIVPLLVGGAAMIPALIFPPRP